MKKKNLGQATEWYYPMMRKGIGEKDFFQTPTQHINQTKYWDAGHFSRDTIPWAGKGYNAGGSTPIEYSANEEIGEGED